MQTAAEEVAARAEHAAKIDENINYLVKVLLNNTRTWEWNSDEEISPNYGAIEGDALACLQRLKILVKDDSEKISIINEIETDASTALEMIVHHRAIPNDSISPDEKARKHRFKNIKKKLSETISTELLPLASEERQIVQNSPALQAEYRNRARQVLVIAAVFNVLLAIGLVVYFNRDIVKRLSTIFDNSLRLASRQALHPPSKGTDEIARLDQMFHTMAEELAESARKETLVIDNAQDVICSFDAKGIFITVNDAVKTHLGYETAELVGSRISNLVSDKDRTTAQNNFKLLMQGESIAPFEIQMVKKNGKTVDMLTSAQWSASESSMFCVMHNVTERREAERLRQEVIQMVSHDLRTPLTTIRGILDIVASGRVGELTDKGKSMIQMADHSSMLMMALARDLLEIEKLESGMLELYKNQILLKDVFSRSIDSVNIIAQQRKVSISAEPTELTVFADGDRIVQILVNLITNAVKFSPPNSKITISARQKDALVEISVADEGRGIPANQISSIFERFKQVRESDSKTEGGSGLGLAICKALVELHGGIISVRSEEGKGSVFTFSIPYETAPVSLTQV